MEQANSKELLQLRQERRTAFVSRYLIVAGSGNPSAEEGQLKEEQDQYTFVWKGPDHEHPSNHEFFFSHWNGQLPQVRQLQLES